MRFDAGSVDGPRVASGEILVVDDDDGLREAVERLLRAAGYAPRSFASSEDLLASPRTPGPACLIADVRLPGLSGFELRERLAAEGRLLPVIYITAHDGPAVRARAERDGALAVLAKPFDGRRLLEAVRRGLGR